MESICDICGSPEITWLYQCDEFSKVLVAETVTGEFIKAPPINSDAWWVLCDSCHKIVESGDRRLLATTSIDSNYQRLQGDEEHRDIMIELTEEFHRVFWETKRPPEPLTEEHIKRFNLQKRKDSHEIS